MENTIRQIVTALSDPAIATPFWGGVGGIVTAIIKRRLSMTQIVISFVLAALFAHWFAIAIVSFFDLPTQSLAGVGAVLGITSYEVTRVLISGEWVTWIRNITMRNRKGKN